MSRFLESKISMLVGALTLVSGLAVVATQNYAATFLGITMTYGGFLLAYTAFMHWADDRDTARHVARSAPRLEAVLDRNTVAAGDAGTIVGRFRGRWLEILTTSETYRVRLLLAGAGGLPWIVFPDGQGLELKSRSRSLESKLRQAGVVTLVTERPELASFSKGKSPWSVSYAVGHICEVDDHSSISVLEYTAVPRTCLWRHITDEDLRVQFGLLVDLADINSKVNVGKPDDVDPSAAPAKWLKHVDKAVLALCASVAAVFFAVKVFW